MYLNSLRATVLGALLGLSSHLAWAETGNGQTDAPVELETMEVTGSQMDNPSYNVMDATSATKTDTPIMEIPQSIQVIPNAILVDQDQQTLSSAIENISSVVAPKTTELLTSEFIIRGFKSNTERNNFCLG